MSLRPLFGLGLLKRFLPLLEVGCFNQGSYSGFGELSL